MCVIWPGRCLSLDLMCRASHLKGILSWAAYWGFLNPASEPIFPINSVDLVYLVLERLK